MTWAEVSSGRDAMADESVLNSPDAVALGSTTIDPGGGEDREAAVAEEKELANKHRSVRISIFRGKILHINDLLHPVFISFVSSRGLVEISSEAVNVTGKDTSWKTCRADGEKQKSAHAIHERSKALMKAHWWLLSFWDKDERYMHFSECGACRRQ